MELVLGRYVRGPLIGAGGMGAIHIGFDRERDGAPVVLKTLLPELARVPRMMAQFRDEARIAQRVRHPNVVEVYGFGDDAGTFTLAMEYVPGVSLAELMKRSQQLGRPLPIALAVRIVRDALLGLDGAHRATLDDGRLAEIVHRDVSPQNLMVRKDGVTKIVDFGIARAAVRETRTATGMVKGKLGYMSPEQVDGAPLDARSDQFSMGIILWELCAGRRLFNAVGDLEMMEQILAAKVPPLTEVVPDFDPELSACAARLLSRTAERRFPTCADAARALSALADRWTQAEDLHAPLERIGWQEPLYRASSGAPLFDDAEATQRSGAPPLHHADGLPHERALEPAEPTVEVPLPKTEEASLDEPTAKMPPAPAEEPKTLVEVPWPGLGSEADLSGDSETLPAAQARSRSPILFLSLAMNAVLAVGLVAVWLSVRGGPPAAPPSAPPVAASATPAAAVSPGPGHDDVDALPDEIASPAAADVALDADEEGTAPAADAGSAVESSSSSSGSRARRGGREGRGAKARASRAAASMAAATEGTRFSSIDEAVLFVRTECQGVVPCAVEASPANMREAMATLGMPELSAYFRRVAACAEKCWAKKPVKRRDDDRAGGDRARGLREVEKAKVAVIQGRFEEARGHAQRALRLDPKLADAHRILGQSYQRDGDHARAVSHYQSYLRLGGQNTPLIGRYLDEHAGR